MHAPLRTIRTLFILSTLGGLPGCIFSETESESNGTTPPIKDMTVGGNDMMREDMGGGPDMPGGDAGPKGDMPGQDMNVCPQDPPVCSETGKSCYRLTPQTNACPKEDCVECPEDKICTSEDIASCMKPVGACQEETIALRGQCKEMPYARCRSISIEPTCEATQCAEEAARQVFCHGQLLQIPEGQAFELVTPSESFGHQVIIWENWAFVSDPGTKKDTSDKWPQGAVFVYKRETEQGPWKINTNLTSKDTLYRTNGPINAIFDFGSSWDETYEEMGYFGASISLDLSDPSEPLLYVSSTLGDPSKDASKRPTRAGVTAYRVVGNSIQYKEKGSIPVAGLGASIAGSAEVVNFGTSIDSNDGLLAVEVQFAPKGSTPNLQSLKSSVLVYDSKDLSTRKDSPAYLDSFCALRSDQSPSSLSVKKAPTVSGFRLMFGNSVEVKGCLINASGVAAGQKDIQSGEGYGFATGEAGVLSAKSSKELIYTPIGSVLDNASPFSVSLPGSYVLGSKNAIRFRPLTGISGLGYYAIHVLDSSVTPQLPTLFFVKEVDITDNVAPQTAIQNAIKWLPSQDLPNSFSVGGRSRWNADFDFEVSSGKIRVISSAARTREATEALKANVITGTIPTTPSND